MQLTRMSLSALALGAASSITIVSSESPETLEKQLGRLWNLVLSFEKRFSRFLYGSETTKINRSAGQEVPISHAMKQLLVACKQYNHETNGVFNPFILPALERAGYTKSVVAGYEKENEDYSNREVHDFSALTLSDNTIKIPASSALDFGGIGKGYLADLVLQRARSYNLHGFCISLGGDVAGFGADENSQRWTVSIQDAINQSGVLDILFSPDTDNFHIATSGVITRRFDQNHHLIDTATEKPADTDILLATVVAESTTRADVLASYAVTRKAKRAIVELPNMGAHSLLLQTKHGRLGYGILTKEKIYA